MTRTPPYIGPTGKFPLGKLKASDEGELAVGMVRNGKIIELHFGTPVTWVALDTKTARMVAEKLIENADKIDGGK